MQDGAIEHLKNYAGNGKGKWVDNKLISTYARLEQFDEESPAVLNLKLIGKKISWNMKLSTADDPGMPTLFVMRCRSVLMLLCS